MFVILEIVASKKIIKYGLKSSAEPILFYNCSGIIKILFGVTRTKNTCRFKTVLIK